MRSPLPRRALVAVLGLALLVGAVPASAAGDPSRVVRGSDGWLFIAQDWSVPCQYRGQAAATAARAKGFVDAVQASGRDATFLLGPDKGTARRGNVPATAPERACGETEKAAVWRELQARLGPDLLDLRRPLAAAGARWQTYWRQDTHWTPTAGTVYAREVAARLDLVLARRLRLEPAEFTRRGDLADVLGIPGSERVTGVRLVNPGVRVTELPRGDRGIGQGARQFTATPTVETARVVPGRTLFLGDSFDGTVVTQLAPLFEHSTFLWPDGRTTPQQLLDRIALADRVVVERVERFSATWRPYDADVVRALRALPRRSS